MGITAPRYSFGGSDSFPVLRLFPPFLKSELYLLVSEEPECKRFADSFNRFVMITFAAILSAATGVLLSLIAYRYFSYKGFFYPTFLLLALCVASNFMAWYNLRRMGKSFEKFFNEKREKDKVFQHYEIGDNGVFKRDISEKKTDLI